MSEDFVKQSHDKTGIKTSTFYSKKNLELYHKVIKLRTGANSRTIQPVNKSAHDKPSQRPNKNKRKKLVMSHHDNRKKKAVASGLERLTNCKASDITDLQTGKRLLERMDSENSEQVKKCKKIKLDFNENLESKGKCLAEPRRDILACTEEKLETDTKELLASEITDENGVGGTKKNIGECEDDIFGTPLSSCQSDGNIKERVQNIAKSRSPPNINDNDLAIGQKESSTTQSTISKLEDDIFGSPISPCWNGRKTVENNKQLNILSNVNGSSTPEQHKLSTPTEAENGIFGTPYSSCESPKSPKQLPQSYKKSPTPHKKMGCLDAFILKERKQTSKIDEKLNDSAFHEPFKILGELPSQEYVSCSSTDTSPLLFSQSSTSSGCSSKTKSTSPESQSSITKYFTPLRKSSPTVMKNTNLLPGSDKGKRQMKGRTTNSRSNSQRFLDAGQKIGHVTCPTCNMVYTIAQPEDEAYHMKFHHKLISALRFKGWKTERVVEHFDDGRVIVVLPQDPQSHLKKVASVRTVVDDELGFSSETSLRTQESKTYLFVADKKVVGCVVAVVIQEGYPLLPYPTSGDKVVSSEQGAWCCSSEPVRARCGISRVWVLQQYRRKKIATRILDCVRNDFMFGAVVSKDLLAFSDPTPLGKQLAESYCGTENFLVFR